MTEPIELIRQTIDAYTQAVSSVREFVTKDVESDDPTVMLERIEFFGLDTGLTTPRFLGLLLLTYTPQAASNQNVRAKFEDLDRVDALTRTAEIVERVKSEGHVVAVREAEALTQELKEWAENMVTVPEIETALALYRANPSALNTAQ